MVSWPVYASTTLVESVSASVATHLRGTHHKGLGHPFTNSHLGTVIDTLREKHVEGR